MQGSEKFIIRMFLKSEEKIIEIQKRIKLSVKTSDARINMEAKLYVWKHIRDDIKKFLIEASAEKPKELITCINKPFEITIPIEKKKKKKT